MELRRRNMSSSQGGKLRVFCIMFVTATYGVRKFRTIQGFSDYDSRSMALVLMGMCTKDFLVVIDNVRPDPVGERRQRRVGSLF